jgi:hypothetical protein
MKGTRTMAFGFGKKKPSDKGVKQAASKKVSASKKPAAKKSSSQADEAKALLEKMKAKKAAGDCPFC